MESNISKPGRKRIIVASTFSGMDLFLLGCVKAGMFPGYAVELNFWASVMHAANFKNPDGTSVIDFINISIDEYSYMKTHIDEDGRKDLEDQVGKFNGQNVRTKLIGEIQGVNIRERIESKYGKDIFIILIGGPPCTDYSKVNKKKRTGEANRNYLVFEYLRILKGLNPDVALMEEVSDFGQGQFKQIYNEFHNELAKLPYKVAEQDMNALHYGGNQSRLRKIIMMVHHNLSADPVFPDADITNVKRVKDFLDIDHFHSGHFTDTIKNSNHFMCTVTSGSPLAFYKDGQKRPPTIEELLKCMDVEPGMYNIPEQVPTSQIRKAIGNGVCVSMSFALAKTIIEKILKLKSDGDGYWISNNVDPNGPKNNPKTNLPVTPNITPPIKPAVPNNTGQVYTSKNIGKIISSEYLCELNFPCIIFRDRWAELIGNPSTNFHCVVHGLSGHGKSTFCIIFAKYLADNHGTVLYISAEEGISKTLQDKFLINECTSQNLHVVDVRKYDDIVKYLLPRSYSFVFIDSLNTMKIDAAKLKSIKEMFKYSALITICQATKSGNMRGSYEIVHDADIEIKVEDGLATTIKNRFKQIGKVFTVFHDQHVSQTNTSVRKKIKTTTELIEELEDKLAIAVDDENYELAVKLRDQIENLKNKIK